MDERRKEPRVNAFKRARVYCKGNGARIETLGLSHSGIDCVVNCLSSLGARLEFEAPPELPSEIIVYFFVEETGIPARVVWRGGTLLGVQFSQPFQWMITDETHKLTA